MKKLSYMALGLIGIMGTLSVGVANAETTVSDPYGSITYSLTGHEGTYDASFITINDGTTKITILDRNLGATAAGTGCEDRDYVNHQYSPPLCSGIDNTYGYLFQWGNNYGFPSHGELSNMSSTLVSSPINIPYSSSTFITGYNNWMNDNSVVNLWGGTTNDSSYSASNRQITNAQERQGPCPDGFHVPSAGELYKLHSMFDNKADIHEKLLIPFAGYRKGEDGSLVTQGYWIGLMSSSINPNQTINYNLLVVKINNGVQSYMHQNPRSTAQSVRCFYNNYAEYSEPESGEITSIGITGLVYPTVGQTLQEVSNSISNQGFAYTSEGYQVYSSEYGYYFGFQVNDNNYWTDMVDNSATFTANDSYRIEIRLVPTSGNNFGNLTCSNVTINGANCDDSNINTDSNAGWLTIWKEFTLSAPAPTEVTEITISGITNPVLGYYPVTGGITITSTPEGVAHVISPWWSDSYGNTTCPMGVCSESWDTSYFSYQDYASTKKYYLVIPYSLDEGYVLADNATITTNGNGTVGKTTAYIEVDNQYVAYDGVKITYNASDLQGPTTISAISITGAVAPIGGTTPVTNGTSIEKLLPEQGITIGTVKWYHSDGYNNRGYVLTDDTQFVAGNQYELVVEVTEDYGYDLNSYYDNPATTLTVNGENGRVQYNSKRELTKVYTATEPALNTYTVTWKNGETILETDENVVEGATPSYDGVTPTKAATSSYTYSFKGWSKDGTNVVDLATETITENTIYSAIFTQKKKSGGGGGGSNGGSTTSNTGDNANIGNIANVNTGDTTNITNENKSEEKQENNAENQENTQNDSQKVLKDGLTQEFHDAYDFAHKHGITTMPSAKEADMNGPLTRIAMAKMLSQYAMNVLLLKPDTTKKCSFNDVPSSLDAQYNNGVTLACQLGLMGIGIDNFRPFDLVPRSEFGTALSRMLFGTADGDGAYYETHLKKLKEEGIITNDNPNLQEARGYVMIMLMRSAK